MIDALLDVLNDLSGVLVLIACSVVWTAISHLRHLARLRASAALHDPQGAPLDPEHPWVQISAAQRGWFDAQVISGQLTVDGFRADETWSNVAMPPGGQRYMSESGLDQIELEARSAYTAARIADGIADGSLTARFFPHSRPYDWSDDADLA